MQPMNARKMHYMYYEWLKLDDAHGQCHFVIRTLTFVCTFNQGNWMSVKQWMRKSEFSLMHVIVRRRNETWETREKSLAIENI